MKGIDGRNKKVLGTDLFGEAITQDALLRDKYIEPPFSVLDSRGGSWQKRKRLWQAKGLKSELGRGENMTFNIPEMDGYRDKAKEQKLAQCLPTSIGEKYGRTTVQGTSIFDPVLCELMYHWFCPEGGRILDFFAGGSVRGIVATYLGYDYTGIDLRAEQIAANVEQGREILEPIGKPMPRWIAGDSDAKLTIIGEELAFAKATGKDEGFDMLFTCPPYLDLEVYSDDPADLSNMDDDSFLTKYCSIIKKGCALLKPESFAVIVVGEVRDEKGFYRDFIGMTKHAFGAAGLGFYNDIVLLNAVGTASVRASNSMRNKKVVKTHQNVLVFYKGNPKNIQKRFFVSDDQMREEAEQETAAILHSFEQVVEFVPEETAAETLVSNEEADNFCPVCTHRMARCTCNMQAGAKECVPEPELPFGW